MPKQKPQKNLLRVLKKHAGRNNTGRVTMRHRGGGVKRRYRLIEFGQERLGHKATVVSLQYDPNRTCRIALIEYDDKECQYILAPHDLKQGDTVFFGEKAELSTGNRMRLKCLPVGTGVYNIELSPFGGGKLCRSAGVSAQIMAQEGKYALLKMPSGEVRKILSSCFASLGVLSNPEHRFQQWGKAGTSRKMGFRPTVRGSAMNACDHPHGGGKNKQPIGRHPRTAWGKPALGVKTRRNKRSNRLIISRRPKKK